MLSILNFTLKIFRLCFPISTELEIQFCTFLEATKSLRKALSRGRLAGPG